MIRQQSGYFSIVCIYNSKELLEKYLLKSLENQDCPHEIILLDNRYGQFSSAAAAFNSVLDQLKGELVVFAHQDVSLGNADALSGIYRLLHDKDEMIVAGVAGKKPGRGTFTNITHGDPPIAAGNPIGHVKEVQTLDGCFFIVSRKLLEKIGFDQDVCSGWSLYAVEYCLSARFKASAEVLVLPVKGFYHRSKGPGDFDDFFRTLRKISEKHKGSVKRIYTTCGNWPTSNLHLDILISKKILKQRIKERIRSVFGQKKEQ